jgi:pimeloyl-ACP methyl ester carboxylesterase
VAFRARHVHSTEQATSLLGSLAAGYQQSTTRLPVSGRAVLALRRWRTARFALPLIDPRHASMPQPNASSSRKASAARRAELRLEPNSLAPEPELDGLHEIVLHGHRVFYRSCGSGPVVVLVHGITSTSATWATVLPYLGERFTVIAPDLLGHGESAKPRGDYSLGAYASGIRDLLIALGHERATFVGHSLGGGVAMQLAYQFPEHCERLVLVSSGGLGRDISALLRAASLPGSELVLPLLVNERVVGAGRAVGRLLARIGLRADTDVGEVLRGHASLSDGEARAAFLHTLRAIVDPGGQRVDASDRLYLAQAIPFLLIWGERDPIIPVKHATAAHRLVPGSRLELFAGAGHFPHLDDPLRFVRLLIDFMETSEPAQVRADRWSELLRHGADGN